MILPKPTTFREGQQALYGGLVALAGIAAGAAAIGLVAILVWMPWGPEHNATIIRILGYSLGGFIVMMMFVIRTLAIGGPVRKTRLSINREGAHFESEGDDD